jgi:phosphocarrier protein
MSERAEKTVQIQNQLGLHLRAASKLVQLASTFPCDITLERDGHAVNGKSILNLTTLVAAKGTTVKVVAKGERAAEAVAAIVQLINDKFGESV